MAIDIGTKVRAGFFYRWMSVRRMKEILAMLEDNDLLIPNRVGNLSVHRPGYDRDKECIGFIDFNSEVYEPFEETYELLFDDQEAEGGRG